MGRPRGVNARTAAARRRSGPQPLARALLSFEPMNSPMTRALLCAAAVLLPATSFADPVTAKFTVAPGDEYEVLVRQGGRQLPCPAVVTPERPCELALEKGPATVVATGSPSFEFDYEHERSTRHELHFRRTWPKWVGMALLIASVASFALGSIDTASCSNPDPYKRTRCKSAYVGFVLGGGLLALGLPPLIWGLFTGNRTVSEAL